MVPLRRNDDGLIRRDHDIDLIGYVDGTGFARLQPQIPMVQAVTGPALFVLPSSILRHNFTAYLFEGDTGIRQIQVLLGRESILTTMLYRHLNADKISPINSPLDKL